MVITTALRNIREFGYPLSLRQRETFTANIWEMGITDLIMASTTCLSLPLHLLYKNGGLGGFLYWDRLGMWIQCVFQLGWITFWTIWPFVRDWTWTAQVFFTLHLLALFMKMHSYAFYNGHLAVTLKRLNDLDDPSTATDKSAAIKYPSSHVHLNKLVQEEEEKPSETEAVRRSSVGQLRQELAQELVSPLGGVTYPQNLTLWNYLDYLCCPTLCYEIEFPRTAKRSYMEIFWKSLAVFGCVFLLTIISDEFIIPALDESQIKLQRQQNWQDGALIFAETVSKLLWPFMLTFLLVFLVIFEYLCGAFAEITREYSRHSFPTCPSRSRCIALCSVQISTNSLPVLL